MSKVVWGQAQWLTTLSASETGEKRLLFLIIMIAPLT